MIKTMITTNFSKQIKIGPKHDYKCCICGRKPENKCQGFKGWICDNCQETRQEDIIKHNEKLKEKRKFCDSKIIIKTIDELLKCEYVYFYGVKLYHIAIIKNWQLRMVLESLQFNKFTKAIKKEKEVK